MTQFLFFALTMAALATTGCCTSGPNPAPTDVRPQPVSTETEDLREVENWRPFWNDDMPTHITPQCVHGSITP